MYMLYWLTVDYIRNLQPQEILNNFNTARMVFDVGRLCSKYHAIARRVFLPIILHENMLKNYAPTMAPMRTPFTVLAGHVKLQTAVEDLNVAQ